MDGAKAFELMKAVASKKQGVHSRSTRDYEPEEFVLLMESIVAHYYANISDVFPEVDVAIDTFSFDISGNSWSESEAVDVFEALAEFIEDSYGNVSGTVKDLILVDLKVVSQSGSKVDMHIAVLTGFGDDIYTGTPEVLQLDEEDCPDTEDPYSSISRWWASTSIPSGCSGAGGTPRFLQENINLLLKQKVAAQQPIAGPFNFQYVFTDYDLGRLIYSQVPNPCDDTPDDNKFDYHLYRNTSLNTTATGYDPDCLNSESINFYYNAGLLILEDVRPFGYLHVECVFTDRNIEFEEEYNRYHDLDYFYGRWLAVEPEFPGTPDELPFPIINLD